MFPLLIWNFQSYLGRKKGTSETFLSLGLFISWSRLTALTSKMQPRLQKLSLGSLFSTSVTWTNLKSDVDKFFLKVASTIFKTKYYFVPKSMQNNGLFNKFPKNWLVLRPFSEKWWVWPNPLSPCWRRPCNISISN